MSLIDNTPKSVALSERACVADAIKFAEERLIDNEQNLKNARLSLDNLKLKLAEWDEFLTAMGWV